MRRLLFVAVLLLAGCTGTENQPKPEFTLRDVPSRSYTGTQGMNMLAVDGHGRTCYIAAFGVSKVLLWCESSKP